MQVFRVILALLAIFVIFGSAPQPAIAQEAPCFSVEEFKPFGEIKQEVFDPPGTLAGLQIKFAHSWTAPLGWIIENNGRKVANVKPGETATVWTPQHCRPMARTTQQVNPASAPKVVQVVNFAFRPNSITIRSGETVTWHNQSRLAHSVVSNGAWWGTVEPGQSILVDIWSPGWYSYVCGFHPQMQGAINVVE